MAQDGAAEYIVQVASETRPTMIDNRDAIFDGWVCVIPCGEDNIEVGWMPTMDERYRRPDRWIKALAFVGRSHMEARDRLRDELTATREAHGEKLTEIAQQGMKLSKLGSELAASNEALRAELTELESQPNDNRSDLMHLMGFMEGCDEFLGEGMELPRAALLRMIAILGKALGFAGLHKTPSVTEMRSGATVLKAE